VIWPPGYLWTQTLELGWGRLSAHTCGWGPDEAVRVKLTLPDGTTVSEKAEATLAAGEGYGVARTYTTAVDGPEGVYTLQMEGISGTVEYSRPFVAPTGPRLLWERSGGTAGSDDLFLYNFAPSETVRLLAYELASARVGGLAGWGEVQVDERGQLAVGTMPTGTFTIGGYAALGQVSGEALGRRFVPAADAYVPMFEDDASVLSEYVLALTSGEQLNIRGGPSAQHRIVTKVDSGTRLRVIGPPSAGGDEEWLHISLDYGTEGWVSSAWVEPVPAPTATPAPEVTPTPASGEKLVFVARGQAECGGLEPMPGCEFTLEKWVGAEGPIAPGEPVKILLMHPRSSGEANIDACQGFKVEAGAFTWSSQPRQIRVKGEPCDLDPGYLFCVCTEGDFVQVDAGR
jgi:hypothetical protein